MADRFNESEREDDKWFNDDLASLKNRNYFHGEEPLTYRRFPAPRYITY